MTRANAATIFLLAATCLVPTGCEVPRTIRLPVDAGQDDAAADSGFIDAPSSPADAVPLDSVPADSPPLADFPVVETAHADHPGPDRTSPDSTFPDHHLPDAFHRDGLAQDTTLPDHSQPPDTAADSSAPGAVTFAVIGDYGKAGTLEADVARLVKSWAPDFIVTTGDNNYENGAASTIDTNIGQYYQEFIHPYYGTYGPGTSTNRFWPSLGNHDWVTPGARPYLDYFTLPGNERYYDVVVGPVHLFIVDSDPHEPDGITSTSIQGNWLRERLAASTSRWKLVFFHHPPYSSGDHGSTTSLQWPFASWGASAVIAGHDHTYERIVRDGFAYFVNGLGGKSMYGFGTPVTGSQVRYNADSGAMRVTAGAESIRFEFLTRAGAVVDSYAP